MWIVKTLGRRTRAGVDRVYSVNGVFITQDLEQAVGEAIAVFKDEIAGNVWMTACVIANPAPAPRPQDTSDYWNCTGAWSKAS